MGWDVLEEGAINSEREKRRVWTWSYANEAGVVVSSLIDTGLEFDTQQEAEQWLGDQVDELLDEGITAVSLSDGHQTIYGPMPLTPA